ncbi:MAG: type II secretion system protein [Candidatus Brocadiia bacterium]
MAEPGARDYRWLPEGSGRPAFTLIELLMVIAIVAILAALLMPALTIVRRKAAGAACRSNLHNQGAAFAMLRGDRSGLWPGWVGEEPARWAREGRYYVGPWEAPDGPPNVSPEPWVRARGCEWYQLVAEGYVDDLDIYNCPALRPTPDYVREIGSPVRVDCPQRFAGSGECDFIAGVEYGIDTGRIDRNSVPGRVVAADPQELRVVPTGGTTPPAHQGGANVLFADGAVRWAAKVEPHASWIRASKGQMSSYADGYVPNPRTDEDAPYADSVMLKQQLEADMDDIYVDERGWGPSPPGTEAGAQVPAHVPLARWEWPWDATHTAWRFYQYAPCGGTNVEAANRMHVYYPQRGIFANEPRWNRHDSRVVFHAPWNRNGITGR